ncbi:agmatinase [Candidatus Fermentibacteria bacterium]|nr:agmatinase [Candidatus Fermentibacteria bacterium]
MMFPFGGITPAEGAPVRIAVIPCGFEVSTTFHQGTRFGPRRLLEASTEIELFDLELGFSPWDGGILTLEEPPLMDAAGPVIESLERLIGDQLDAGRFPLLLGGEHTIAVGGGRAVAARFPEVGFLQIDAHSDYRASYHGNPLNHACVGRRLSELGPVVMVGIRSVSEEEWRELPADPQIALFPAHALRTPGWQEQVVEALPPNVYLTLDLDGLDPSVVPGVGTPEPGGIGWNDLLTVLHVLFEKRQVVGADICELRPEPGTPRSESVAARIAQRICGLHLRSPHGRWEDVG